MNIVGVAGATPEYAAVPSEVDPDGRFQRGSDKAGAWTASVRVYEGWKTQPSIILRVCKEDKAVH